MYMKKFWIYNLALSLSLIIVYLIVNYTEKDYSHTIFIAHIILGISVIQLIAESVCAIVWMHKQSVNSLIFGISSIFFSVLISLYMWNLVYLNCG